MNKFNYPNFIPNYGNFNYNCNERIYITLLS